jgi:predicted lactoylglutathione lyase
MFGAQQVNLYVEDIKATAVFYRGLPGFTETFRMS